MFSFEAMSYRDDEAALRARREELVATLRREIDVLDGDAPRVFARRVARISGGAVAIAGACCLVLVAAATRGVPFVVGRTSIEAPLTPILLASALAAPIAAVLAWIAARIGAKRIAERVLAGAITGDPRTDVERLSRASLERLFAELADRMETRSVWAPLVGAALIVPLSLHFGVAAVLAPSSDITRGFDFWILASLVLTIPAHAVLALLAVRFARRLRAWRPGDGAHAAQPPSAWAPLLWTIVAGCVPGVVLYLVPPILVAVTGLFVPIAFTQVRRAALRERGALDAIAGPATTPPSAEIAA